MVEIFNDFFSSVFTKEDCTSLPYVVDMPCEAGVLNGVVINESDVLTTTTNNNNNTKFI